MPWRWLDGELKTELHIGLLLTHGTKAGETMDFSESEEVTTNVESKDKQLQESQNLNNPTRFSPKLDDKWSSLHQSQIIKINAYFIILSKIYRSQLIDLNNEAYLSNFGLNYDGLCN